MVKHSARKVAFVSSFLPRQCGIATFTSDLIKGIKRSAGDEFEPLVVAMQSSHEYRYREPVKFEIRANVKNDYVCAADYINFSHVNVVSIQHEFGLFGGAGGSYLSLLLNQLNAPIITTLHTVLEEPPEEYFKSLRNVCEASHKIIVMNKRGVSMLHEIYDIPKKKIVLIPHGIPDLPFVDSNYYKYKFGMEGRKTILTFGLLNRNKGIEVMLQALPKVVEVNPSVLYIILGMTHPEVLRREGESYRFELQRMVKDLGLQENVIFHNRFVNNEELDNFLCAADIYATPYLAREQLTSGTLAYAVGSGKAVVSTPYWAAQELLADGRGKLVRFSDSKHMAEAVLELLDNNTLFYSKRRLAYDFGRNMTWPRVGREYWKLFSAKRLPIGTIGKTSSVPQEAISIIEVPEPPLNHLQKLTDDTGLYQHAKFTIPNREYGYCTDDNARAAIAMAKYYAQYAEPEALRLFDIYLSFICHSQRNDGTVRNFLDFDRRWQKNEPVHDALGRTLWAFGTVMAKPPSLSYLSIIKDCFDKSVKHVGTLFPRGMAYSILGMSDYLAQFPGASDIKRQLATAADRLVELYEATSQSDWRWFENMLTYDNGVLPHALFVSTLVLGDKKYLEVALESCEFLLENTYNGHHFSFIGCNGWYKRGKQRAMFDQQPIEAGSTVMMLRAAYEATRESKFLSLQRKAFDWFLGENDLHIPIYDFKTKGCYDGLKPGGVNLNQGAESMVSFLLSLLCIVESYSAIEEGEYDKKRIQREIKSDVAEKKIKIETVSIKTKAEKTNLAELS